MSRSRLTIAIALVCALGIAAYLYLRSGDEPETAVVERGSIDVTIATVGTVQLREEHPVRAATGGTVQTLGAAVGDTVAAGDILVMLDPAELDQVVTDAERLVEAAEFELQFAELRLAEDEESLGLQQDVLEAQIRLDSANETLTDARAARADAAILAETDGVVLEFFVGPGDRIGANQPVAQLQAPGSLELVADIDELDLANVLPGAPVRFRLDAYPATEIEGEIAGTAPLAIQRGGATLFPANVDFTPPDGLDIRPGMNADVTIVTDLREDVLLIPERALRTVGQRAFVEVERDGDVEEVEVILGYRAGGVAEVVDGLTEGERIRLR